MDDLLLQSPKLLHLSKEYLINIGFRIIDYHIVSQIASFWTNVKNAERYTSPRKEAGLVIYLAFLAKVANLYYRILTAFKK